MDNVMEADRPSLSSPQGLIQNSDFDEKDSLSSQHSAPESKEPYQNTLEARNLGKICLEICEKNKYDWRKIISQLKTSHQLLFNALRPVTKKPSITKNWVENLINISKGKLSKVKGKEFSPEESERILEAYDKAIKEGGKINNAFFIRLAKNPYFLGKRDSTSIKNHLYNNLLKSLKEPENPKTEGRITRSHQNDFELNAEPEGGNRTLNGTLKRKSEGALPVLKPQKKGVKYPDMTAAFEGEVPEPEGEKALVQKNQEFKKKLETAEDEKQQYVRRIEELGKKVQDLEEKNTQNQQNQDALVEENQTLEAELETAKNANAELNLLLVIYWQRNNPLAYLNSLMHQLTVLQQADLNPQQLLPVNSQQRPSAFRTNPKFPSQRPGQFFSGNSAFQLNPNFFPNAG